MLYKRAHKWKDNAQLAYDDNNFVYYSVKKDQISRQQMWKVPWKATRVTTKISNNFDYYAPVADYFEVARNQLGVE